MYTNIPKPTGTPYTKLSAFAPVYDESTVAYDDANNYYDGINQSAYTNLAKPTGVSYTIIAKPT